MKIDTVPYTPEKKSSARTKKGEVITSPDGGLSATGGSDWSTRVLPQYHTVGEKRECGQFLESTNPEIVPFVLCSTVVYQYRPRTHNLIVLYQRTMHMESYSVDQ